MYIFKFYVYLGLGFLTLTFIFPELCSLLAGAWSKFLAFAVLVLDNVVRTVLAHDIDVSYLFMYLCIIILYLVVWHLSLHHIDLYFSLLQLFCFILYNAYPENQKLYWFLRWISHWFKLYLQIMILNDPPALIPLRKKKDKIGKISLLVPNHMFFDKFWLICWCLFWLFLTCHNIWYIHHLLFKLQQN